MKYDGYYKDLSGKTFGQLYVNSFSHSKHTHSYWNCTCLRCGKECVRPIGYLLYKHNPMCQECVLDEMSSDVKKNNVEIKGDYAIINGDILVDTEDLPKLLSFRRYISKCSRGYACFDYKTETYTLHRFIMGLPRQYDKETTLIVDHINGNILDNRKRNLRICRREKNPMNCKLYKNNKSGYKGIAFIKRLGKWQVNISDKGKTVYLGVYKNLEDAIKVRKEAEEKYYGEYVRKE